MQSTGNMLVQLGRRDASLELADALLACHARIRGFLALAARLADTPGAPAGEVELVAAQIVRYFTTAFPLHLADEERLAAHVPMTPALAQMHVDHTEHAALVSRLVALCTAIAVDPTQLSVRADDLADTCDDLTLVLEAHLSLEELLVFPAVQQLPLAERAELLAEMRDRRDAALRAS